MDKEQPAEHDDEYLDLDHLRDLLTLLREFKVQGFTQGDFAVTLARDLDPDLISVDGKPVKPSTETEVTGFKKAQPLDPHMSGFKHPSLWQSQGGRPYSFNE